MTKDRRPRYNVCVERRDGRRLANDWVQALVAFASGAAAVAGIMVDAPQPRSDEVRTGGRRRRIEREPADAAANTTTYPPMTQMTTVTRAARFTKTPTPMATTPRPAQAASSATRSTATHSPTTRRAWPGRARTATLGTAGKKRPKPGTPVA